LFTQFSDFFHLTFGYFFGRALATDGRQAECMAVPGLKSGKLLLRISFATSRLFVATCICISCKIHTNTNICIKLNVCVLCSLCTATVSSGSTRNWARGIIIHYRRLWGLASAARVCRLYAAENEWRAMSGNSDLAASNRNGLSAVGARCDRAQ